MPTRFVKWFVLDVTNEHTYADPTLRKADRVRAVVSRFSCRRFPQQATCPSATAIVAPVLKFFLSVRL